MKYDKVYMSAIGHELAPVVVSSRELETRLAPMYEKLHIPLGQVEALTGIRERRWWKDGYRVSDGAIAAGRKALIQSDIAASDIEMLIYAGVCRENFEPATACRVAHELGIHGSSWVYDISNACIGVLNGMLDVANRIELGQIRAGMVVSCESAREIVNIMVERMLKMSDMNEFKYSLATLTGGSGAVAVILTDGSFGGDARKLLGANWQSAPENHALATWGIEHQYDDMYRQSMFTDSVNVLNNGVALGERAWAAFQAEHGWDNETIDVLIGHQIGAPHRESILKIFDISGDKDFSTFPYLGNIGTVSLPMTAGIAEQRGFINSGDKVIFFGIGSGLNCLLLGWEWVS